MEELMQYVWRYRLWPDLSLTTADGLAVEVVDQGRLNRGSGPDFFNAGIRIGGELWAGNVEIHVRASDWHRHGHDGDPAYDSVILHVVAYDDCEVCRSDGSVIPQVTMRCHEALEQEYRNFMQSPASELPCARHIADVPAIIMNDWLTALAFERLQRKADDVMKLVEATHGDWNTAAYVTLARAMGFGSNADAMERVARATPLRRIRRHADSQTAVEAMLIGRAGLLADPPRDPYEARLLADFRFYSHKFGTAEDLELLNCAGEPMPYTPPVWNLRQRPANSPLRRVVTLAAFMCAHGSPGHEMLAVGDYEQARQLFSFTIPQYWREHLTFGVPGAFPAAALAENSIRLLCINAIVPLKYAHAEYCGDERQRDEAVEMLQSLKPEKNSVTTLFETAGFAIKDAFASQAVLQLRRAYCEPRKCLYCRLGHKFLSSRIKCR